MVAQGFQNRTLIGTGGSQFDQSLQDLIEQGVARETACVEIVIYFHLIPGAPEVHQLVDLINQGHGASAGCGQA